MERPRRLMERLRQLMERLRQLMERPRRLMEHPRQLRELIRRLMELTILVIKHPRHRMAQASWKCGIDPPIGGIATIPIFCHSPKAQRASPMSAQGKRNGEAVERRPGCNCRARHKP